MLFDLTATAVVEFVNFKNMSNFKIEFIEKFIKKLIRVSENPVFSC
jgi:hypothetical protein